MTDTSLVTQKRLLAWAEENVHYREGFTDKHYSLYIVHVMNLLDDRVHDDEYCCEWVSPYGFVPQAGCPRHD